MALKLRAKVPFPATVSGTGGIKVEKSGGDWVVSPDFSALAVLAGSGVIDPTQKQVWLYDPTLGQYNVLTLAGLGDALYKTTSTTSLAIGTGSQTFTVDSGKDISVGSWVLATSNADATNYMAGQVTSYSGTSLVVNVTAAGGSGTKADWTIRLCSAVATARSSGFSYKWSTDTTSADPTSGFVKANNATFASITSLYISETDNDANALASEIATWVSPTSTVKGRIKIYDPITPSNFMTFDLTARTDNGAYDTLTVTPVANGGSFTNSLALRVSFAPKGDKGDTGATGATSVSGTPSAGQMTKFASASSVQAATAGTDYLTPPSGTAILKANSGAALANATAGSDYVAPGTTSNFTAGFTATSFSAGTKSSGTFTPDPTQGNLQHYTNGGAHTLAPPTSACTMILECTNATAGAITTSGFTIVDGDTYSSTGTKKHIFYITKTNSVSHLNVRYVTGT